MLEIAFLFPTCLEYWNTKINIRLASRSSSLIILMVILMVLVNMGGLMYWWNIQLNAVSLVNLVMAVGISVEFCSHLTRSFAVCVAENKIARAKIILVTMGSSVSRS